jgi:hypothetical protein
MGDHENDDLSPELARLGEQVANLPGETPPSDLVARTLSRISTSYKPVKRVFWMLRPITNPLARVAAAAMIIAGLAPMMDMNVAEPLGAKIEASIIGREAADQVEDFIDGMLRPGKTYSQDELDATIGIRRPDFKPVRRVSLNNTKTKRA